MKRSLKHVHMDLRLRLGKLDIQVRFQVAIHRPIVPVIERKGPTK